MRILVITAYFRPDGGPAAELYGMLCDELLWLGHQVVVLTAVPHYPSGRVAEKYRSWRAVRTKENGVEVIRVPLPSIDRSWLPLRMLQFLAFQLNATFASWNLEFDVFVAHSPALEVWLPFVYHAVLCRKPAVYSVHDVYPDVGIKLGILRHKPLIAAVDALERSCLKFAHKVRILSRSFQDSLLARGVPESKLALIYDWVEIDKIVPRPRHHNSFEEEQNLQGHFVVMYAGNLGFVQALDSVLETAQLLRNDSDICFVLVGDGGARQILLDKAQRLKLDNVRFIPYQPRERMPEVLASAHLALVTLKKGAAFDALPSKIYGILASGRAIIASLDEHSEAWELIRRSGGGICVPPEEPARLAEAILILKRDAARCEEMGRNGRVYAVENHSPRSAAEKFDRLLADALNTDELTWSGH